MTTGRKRNAKKMSRIRSSLLLSWPLNHCVHATLIPVLGYRSLLGSPKTNKDDSNRAAHILTTLPSLTDLLAYSLTSG
ncbi:hypothetical protein C8R45DRAFT_14064 [Mycena sanguinolenta]|nr:hypothetical protein C8R45DRAFT_14064 [Mycena sanguinolenta]